MSMRIGNFICPALFSLPAELTPGSGENSKCQVFKKKDKKNVSGRKWDLFFRHHVCLFLSEALSSNVSGQQSECKYHLGFIEARAIVVTST